MKLMQHKVIVSKSIVILFFATNIEGRNRPHAFC